MKTRKLHIPELMLAVIFAVTGLAGIFWGVYTQERAAAAKKNTCFYHDYACAFFVESTGTDFTRTIPVDALMDWADRQGNVTLLVGGFDGMTLGVYSSDPAFSLPADTGRGLSFADFQSGTAVAMIGNPTDDSDGFLRVVASQSVKTLPVALNSRFENVPRAEIVGTISPIGNDWQSYSIVNLACMTGFLESNCFVLDAGSAGRSETLVREAIGLLQDRGYTVCRYELPSQGLDLTRFFRLKSFNLIVLLFTVLCAVMATVPITLLWIRKRFRDLAVKRLLGFGTAVVVWEILLRFLLLFHIGFVLSYALVGLLSLTGALPFAVPLPWSREILIAYCLSLGFNLLTAAVPIVQSLHIEPGDALRRV